MLLLYTKEELKAHFLLGHVLPYWFCFPTLELASGQVAASKYDGERRLHQDPGERTRASGDRVTADCQRPTYNSVNGGSEGEVAVVSWRSHIINVLF